MVKALCITENAAGILVVFFFKEMLRTPHGMLVSLLGVIVRKPQRLLMPQSPKKAFTCLYTLSPVKPSFSSSTL